ncbi:MurR/RpiR family transcriptional regulator [Enterococcus sp. DIV0876]|uniref:MurR/RpiR family transcriptional regulator n=1 Tax=Enterococcus sp. DIV0876 TaxID=2774633 RepID=UPI003D30121C
MNTNRLNFVYKLNHIVNENEIGTIEYELAKFFLENFKSVKSWNIYQIAESQHVSRASIRRFAQQLGYDNFSDMKKAAETFDDGVNEFQEFYGYSDFLPKLKSNISSLLEELSIRFNTQEVDRLVRLINTNKQVMILCSSNIAGSVKTFQQRMILFGKRVSLLTSKEDLENAMDTKEQPLIIVFSISGLFVSSLLEDLKMSSAKKILFTNNRNPMYNRVFDKLYHLSAQHHEQEITELLYYTYGIDFVLDLLLNGYILEQKKEGNLHAL